MRLSTPESVIAALCASVLRRRKLGRLIPGYPNREDRRPSGPAGDAAIRHPRHGSGDRHGRTQPRLRLRRDLEGDWYAGDSDTLFEIGSVSKTFTATLVSYAQAGGHLSLSDNASRYLPALRGSNLDHVSLLNLGTHTPGGLPLQVPDDVRDDDQLMQYFRDWKPPDPPGTFADVRQSGHRTTRHDCGRQPERWLRHPHGTSGV